MRNISTVLAHLNTFEGTLSWKRTVIGPLGLRLRFTWHSLVDLRRIVMGEGVVHRDDAIVLRAKRSRNKVKPRDPLKEAVQNRLRKAKMLSLENAPVVCRIDHLRMHSLN